MLKVPKIFILVGFCCHWSADEHLLTFGARDYFQTWRAESAAYWLYPRIERRRVSKVVWSLKLVNFLSHDLVKGAVLAIPQCVCSFPRLPRASPQTHQAIGRYFSASSTRFVTANRLQPHLPLENSDANTRRRWNRSRNLGVHEQQRNRRGIFCWSSRQALAFNRAIVPKPPRSVFEFVAGWKAVLKIVYEVVLAPRPK